MKKFNKIVILLLSFVGLFACERPIVPEDDPSVDVEMPKYGYIFFNLAKPSTRGALFEPEDQTLAGQSFALLGYRYPNAPTSTWNTQRIVASQGASVVYGDNDDVQKTAYMGVFVGTSTSTTPTKQLVNWESGVHSYSPLREWQTSLKYAFFAWYPEYLVPNDGKDTDNKTDEFYVGKPFITYELNTGSGKESRQAMIDVMTACRTDYIRSISGPSVSLTMKHRLAALDIKAMSVVDAKSLKKYLTDNEQLDEANSIADNSVVTVKFSNLKLKLNSIKSGAKIPLNTEPDDNNEIEPIEPLKNDNGTDKTFVPEYSGFDCDVPVPYYNDEDDIIDLVGVDEKLILIPQTEEITATLSFTYDVLCDGEKIDFASGSYPPTGAGSNSDIPIYGLEEGKYHYLLITVAKSGISVKVVVEGDNWEGKDDYIDHEFN